MLMEAAVAERADAHVLEPMDAASDVARSSPSDGGSEVEQGEYGTRTGNGQDKGQQEGGVWFRSGGSGLWRPWVSGWARAKRALLKPRFSDDLPQWLRKHITFYRIHMFCFFVVAMIGTLIIYVTPSGPAGPISFIDAMFVATSSVCVNGLITVTTEVLSTSDKILMIILMLVGNVVFASLVPVYVRRYYYHRYLLQEGIHLEDDVEPVSEEPSVHHEPGQEVSGMLQGQGRPIDRQDRKTTPHQGDDQLCRLEDTPAGSSSNRFASAFTVSSLSINLPRGESDGPVTQGISSPSLANLSIASVLSRRVTPRVDVSARNLVAQGPLTPGPQMTEDDDERHTHTWAGETAKANADRFRLTLELIRQQQHTPQHGGVDGDVGVLQQRSMSQALSDVLSSGEDSAVDESKLMPQERRFIELRALELLCWLVPVYMLGFIGVAFVLLFFCFQFWPYYYEVLQKNDVNPFFMAIFQAVAGFTNSGLSLLNDSLMQFQANAPVLIIVAILILVGNTMYAPMLRFILLLIHHYSRGEMRFVAKYLLDHPRKCYTHLFPAPATIWLVITVLLFNTSEFVFFCALDWNSKALDGLSSAVKVLVGFFQSVSTRNAGFTVIAVSMLSPAMLVLYAGMMYIAVYPVFLTRQRSRQQREVYDDEDIGVFIEDVEEGVLDNSVLAHGKKLVARDSILLFLSIFIICTIENYNIVNDPTNFSIFNIIFEVISAYGNVGLSLGYTCVPPSPDETCVSPPFSFAGMWQPGAKFILIMIIFMGRHRGLPDNIDRAIVIPERKQFRRIQPPAGPVPGDPSLLLHHGASQRSARWQPSVLMRRVSSVVDRARNRSHQNLEAEMRVESGTNLAEAYSAPPAFAEGLGATSLPRVGDPQP